jgi:polysaccharide biosynthesis transport protein
MRQTKPFPESEPAEPEKKRSETKPFPDSETPVASLVKVDAKRHTTDYPKGDHQPIGGHTGLEKIPYSYESLALQQRCAGEAISSDSRLALLRDWWRLIYRRKWLIISIMVVALPFVIISAYRKKPIYQATATIDIRTEGSSLKPNDIFQLGTYDSTKAEAFIIRSRPVIERTVANLNLDRYPHFFDVNSDRSAWEAIAALRGGDTEQNNDQASGDRNPAAQDGSAAANALSAGERARLTPYVYTVTGYLRADSVRDTRLLRISFTHTNPEIAAVVANGVAQTFIEYNFQNKTQNFTSASNWLEESTRKLKARVEQAEQKLANYSRDHNIFSLDGKENLTIGKLAQLHGQALQAETDRILKDSLYDQVKQGRVAQLPESFADPKTAELRKTLSDLVVQAAQLSVRFGAKHPKLVEIRQQMSTIQEQIDVSRATLEDRLKADHERAVRNEKSLKAALERTKAEAVNQNQATIQYSVLQQDLATAKALYTDFLNKTSQASIQLAEQYNNVRLIEAAEVPAGPIGPSRGTPILIGLVLSLAFAIGLAWLLENLNTKVRSVEDLNAAVQAPVLAVIPTLSEDALSTIRTGLHNLQEGGISTPPAALGAAKPLSPIVLKDLSAADEAYRMLRTSVLLSTAGRPPKTIMITSGQPGDGKTTTVVNTAIAFTKLKAEVLIIDCDMRRHAIHNQAHTEEQEGLSTFLTGGGNIAEFIERTPIPHLSILPAGPAPPNPSELISSESMREMLYFLANRYKYILIDSPPLVAVTDSIILSTLVDGVILVAKSGKSKSEALRRAFQRLSSVQARVLGVILNDLDVRGEDYDCYFSSNYTSSNYTTDQPDQVKSRSAGA